MFLVGSEEDHVNCKQTCWFIDDFQKGAFFVQIEYTYLGKKVNNLLTRSSFIWMIISKKIGVYLSLPWVVEFFLVSLEETKAYCIQRYWFILNLIENFQDGIFSKCIQGSKYLFVFTMRKYFLNVSKNLEICLSTPEDATLMFLVSLKQTRLVLSHYLVESF